MQVLDKSMKALLASLNFREMRHELISSNVANAETPGYKAKRIEFEEALARALNVDGQQGMAVDDPQHFDVGQGGFDNLEPEIIEDPNGVVSEDGNTVDRDKEMFLMSENKIMYDAAAKLLKIAYQNCSIRKTC